MIIKKRPNSAVLVATDDIKSNTGKELILKSMSNHYRTLLNIKPQIKIDKPKKIAGKHQTKVAKANEFHNVRQTYKSVLNVKPAVDTKKPATYEMTKLSKFYTAKEKFEDMEHIRRLDAMAKRMTSLGKPHERAKNKFDPIINPTYFFKSENDEKGIKLVNLDKFTQKIHEMNTNKKNKSILDEVVYETIKLKKNNVYSNHPKRVKSSSLIGAPDLPKTPKNIPKFTNMDIGINPNFFIYTNPDDIIKEHLKERKITNILKDKSPPKKLTEPSNINKSRDIDKSNLNNSNYLNVNTSGVISDKNNESMNVNDKKLKINSFNKSFKDKDNNRRSDAPLGIGRLEIYKNKELVEQIPLYQYKQDGKEDFKNRIVKHLFANRIYKTKDLEAFIKLLIHKNKDLLAEDEIRKIYDKVKKELEE